jgi:hypothetical protein
MGCLFILMASVFPRTVLFIFWLTRPERMDDIFSSFLWPLLGIVFLPFATLMYVLLYVPGTGVSGSDWIWVAFAGLLDIVHWSLTGNQYGTRRSYEGQPI